MTETITYQEQARKILHEFRFPMHQSGYRQLCTAIPMYAENPEISMTKELYPHLSKQFGRDVESSIRRAILFTWEHGNREAWEKYFPGHMKAPSNLVFIAAIAEQLK